MVLYDNIGGDSLRTIVKNDNYGLYEEYDDRGNIYYLCIPNNNEIEYEIFCGLNKDNIPNDEIVNNVCNIYDKITKDKKNIIYVGTIIEIANLMEAASDNDGKLYNILLDRIHQTVKHAYENIIKEKLAAISNIITMVKQDEDDTKFINWLESNMPSLIHSVSLRSNNYFDATDTTTEIPIIDTSDNSGGAALTGGPSDGELAQNKGFAKKKVPPKNNHGFGNIVLVIIVLMLALVVGVAVAYILIR